MGLDMYLYRKTDVKNWDFRKDKFKIIVLKNGEELPCVNDKKIESIKEDLFYWRKVNCIHNWIVNRCGGGEDNCRELELSKKDFTDLLEIINEVLSKSKLKKGEILESYGFKNGKKVENYIKGYVISNPEIAKKLLPTASGFFFGSIGYDEMYIQDLKETKEAFDKILKETDWDIQYLTYQASW